MNETEFEVEFDRLLAEFTDRVREGETPAIDDYIAEYPQHREQIESLFPVVGCLETTRKERSDHVQPGQRRWKFAGRNHLGDYELVREIGRGGMGVVYEARQRSLDRKVALKVLPAEQAMTPASIARFQREARMAAQLHHSHIVPVLGHGQDEGNYFIAMQLIDGVGLNRILAILRAEPQPQGSNELVATPAINSESESTLAPAEEIERSSQTIKTIDLDFNSESSDPNGSPTYDQEFHNQLFPDGYGTKTFWNRVAEIGQAVARALAHSHEHFILHRDIKPSNLIIDRHGKTWVADFGLARSFEGTTDSDMTRETGTPRYMSPEQILGRPTERSDIYSLGLTLYEIVTRERVFQNHGDGNQNSFRAQKNQAIAPVRSVAPQVPVDLAKIIDKCVRVDPIERYQAGVELADDFERFQEKRSLKHLNTPFWIKGYRWIKRNPALAVAAAVALLSLAAVAFVSGNSFRSQQAELNRTKSALQISFNTLDKVYDRLAPSDLTLLDQISDPDVNQSQLSKSNALLLEELLDSYDQLAHLDGDERIQVDAARANFRVGEIHRRLGHINAAQAAFQRSIEINESVAKSNPDEEAGANIRIVQAFIALASTEPIRNSPSRLRNLTKAVEIADANLAKVNPSLSKPNRRAIQFELAKALYHLAQKPKRSPAQFPSTGESSDSRSSGKKGRGKSKRNSKAFRLSGADRSAYLTRAISLLENWPRPRPETVRSLLSICYGEKSSRHADEDFKKAIQIQRSLVQEFPGSQLFKSNLAALLGQVDPLILKPEQYPSTVRILKESNRVAAQLDRNDATVRALMKHNHHKLAILYNKIAIDSRNIPAEVMAKFTTEAASQPIEEAVFHGTTALEMQEAENERLRENQVTASRKQTNGDARRGRPRPGLHPLAWTLRFQVCLAESLWHRNQSTDRVRVKKMVEETADRIGAVNQSDRQDRQLMSIFRQLRDITNQ